MSGLQPEHPAARVVVDEQGRLQTLGTSEAELRLQCIHVVGPRGDAVISAADLVCEAEVLFRYVMGGVGPVLPNLLLELPTTKPSEPNALWWAARFASDEAILCRTPPAEAKKQPEAVSSMPYPRMVYDGSPESAKAIGAWVKAEGRGLVLNAGDIVEMALDGRFERIQYTKGACGEACTVIGPLQFLPKAGVDALKASPGYAADHQPEKVKPPEPPALSEVARQAIRERLESSKRSLKHVEEMAATQRGYSTDNAENAKRYEEVAERHREAIAVLQRDLGEVPPS